MSATSTAPMTADAKAGDLLVARQVRKEFGGLVAVNDVDVPLYQYGIFGLILVLVMLFKPEGLIPSARRKAEFEEGVHDEPLYDVQR